MHVGQLELSVLELADALTELDALLGVLDGFLNGALAQTQSLRSDTDTAAVQGLHSDLEAVALLAQQTILGDNAILEDQVAGGRTADTHLLLVLALREAGIGALDDEGRDLLHGTALLVGGLAGNSDDNEDVGNVTVGDEALGAVQDPVLAGLIQDSSGLLALSVGTSAGLGQTEGADPLALAQLGQILHLLFLGTMLKDGSAAQRGVSRDDNGSGAADLGQLFHSHGVSQNVSASAAVLLGEVDAHHAQLSHLLDGLHGEALFLIDLLGQGLDFGLRKLTVHFAEHLMLFAQNEIHKLPSLRFHAIFKKFCELNYLL